MSPSPREALAAALPADALEKLDAAGVAEYIEGTLDDDDIELDDLKGVVAPLLVDTEVATSDEEAERLCEALHKLLRGDAVEASAAPAPAAKLLSAPVSMFAMVEADEKRDAQEAAKIVPKAQVNYNSEMKAPVNSLIEEDESDEAMARRWKTQRRGEKKLKREARREKVLAMQRDEFMKELTREPVVLHWRGGGGGSSDILLKQVHMDVNGLTLLEDTDVTLVSGRKYGLVGRNGIGKTTFLKYAPPPRVRASPSAAAALCLALLVLSLRAWEACCCLGVPLLVLLVLLVLLHRCSRRAFDALSRFQPRPQPPPSPPTRRLQPPPSPPSGSSPRIASTASRSICRFYTSSRRCLRATHPSWRPSSRRILSARLCWRRRRS